MVEGICVDVQPVADGITISQPDGAKMKATHTGLLPVQHLPLDARRAHIFPQLKRPLVSIAQFCDSGFEVRFNNQTVNVYDGNTVILTGTRNYTNGLWNINIGDHAPPRPFASSAECPLALNVHEMTTHGDVIKYLHQACWSPVTSTWTAAIDAGYFATWPGLTAKRVRKHLDKAIATSKGHMKQIRQGLRSTKQKEPSVMTAPPPNEIEGARTGELFCKTVELTGKNYTDQTGRFPVTSSKGSKYVMVAYNYDCNAILAEPIQSRSEASLVRAHQKIHAHLSERGLKPKLIILDNECPSGLKQFFRQQDTEFQLVPPNLHRANAAERAIDTFKCHFIAGLGNSRSKLPNAPLVPSPSARHHHPQSPPPIPYQSATVGGGSTQRPLRL